EAIAQAARRRRRRAARARAAAEEARAARVERAVAMARDGATVRDLADFMGITEPSIYKILADAGIPPRGVRASYMRGLVPIERLVELRERGLSYGAIARKVVPRLAPATVYQRIEAWVLEGDDKTERAERARRVGMGSAG
ncbi:MAG: hypothetical protein ACO2ZK_09385, partial [Gemmobacter sp.]